MAEPGAEVAGGLTAPPPPPPPQKTDTAVGDAATTPPLQTDTAGPGTPASTPTPPPQNQTAAAEASGAASPPNQRQTGTGEAAATSQQTQTPSQEKTVAGGAENHLPAPPPLEKGDAAKDGSESKDSATEKPRQAEEQKPGTSRWRRVRSPVLLLLSLFRLRHRRQEQDQLIKQPVIPPPPTEDGSAVDVPHKPATEKDEGEGSKRRRDEADASMSASGRKEAPPPMEPQQTKRRKSLQRTEDVLPPEGVVGSEADASPSPMKRKLRNVGRLVKNTMSWYRRHRSQENVAKPKEEAAAEKEKLAETKRSTSPPEEAEAKLKQDDKVDQSPPHRRWRREEERLEGILEDACRKLVEAEFENLHDDRKKRCLLTFSVFPLGSKVKRQAVTHWWSARFQLPSEKAARNADEIFGMLSDGGFLEPIKNRCSGMIQGCRVNPLVHWMVKHMAKEKYVSDLDGRGNPDEDQPKSEVLCLTPDNRDKMQKLRDDDDLPAPIRPRKTKVPSDGTAAAGTPSQDQQENAKLNEAAILLIQYERKKVILNISAHVYRLPKPLLMMLAGQLEVLQLGRWTNSDDETYMEVEALESLSAIGKLKNLRYLSLRGLSRLTQLPPEVGKLRRLAILDARGCQNLVSVPSATVKELKALTHLDLSECYMLEHIGQGVSALSELREFKGFVFGVGKRRRDACRLQHLAKLKKLRKLTVNVTTDASVDRDEMAQLRKLAGLESLTVTWGELPSVLMDSSQERRRNELLQRWTGLMLPPELKKLDVRCYPKRQLPVLWWLRGLGLNGNMNLKKLYVRGGEVDWLDIPFDNKIEILRLRYLNRFRMKWTDELIPKLNTDTIKFVEVLDKDLKVTRKQTKVVKGDEKDKDDEQEKKMVKEEKEHEAIPIKRRMEIPESTIDENGVWVNDPKEKKAAAGTNSTQQDAPKAEAAATGAAEKAKNGVDGIAPKTETKGKQSSLKGTEGENAQAAEEDRGDSSEVKKVSGGDTVKEEKDHLKTARDEEHNIIKKDEKEHEPALDENRMQERDEMELKKDEEKPVSPPLPVDQSAAAASGGDVKKGAIMNKSNTDNITEVKKDTQDRIGGGMVAAPASGGDVKKGAIMDKSDTDNINEVKKDRQDRIGGAMVQGPGDPTAKEDKGDAGELTNFDGSDADEPQAEGEDEGQKADSEVDKVDEQPTAEEDGGGSNTSAADVASSLAPQLPEPKKENPAIVVSPAKIE